MSHQKLLVFSSLLLLILLLHWATLQHRWSEGDVFEPSNDKSGAQNLGTRSDPIPDQPEIISKSSTEAQSSFLSIGSSSDLELLTYASKFTVRLFSNSGESLQRLTVRSIQVEPYYKQIHAFSDDGTTAIITFTDAITHVFVKHSSGVYEHSGPDFEGTIKRVTKLNVVDDMRFPDDRTIRFEPEVKPIIFEKFPDD